MLRPLKKGCRTNECIGMTTDISRRLSAQASSSPVGCVILPSTGSTPSACLILSQLRIRAVIAGGKRGLGFFTKADAMVVAPFSVDGNDPHFPQ